MQFVGGTHMAGTNIHVSLAYLRFNLGITKIQVIFEFVILGAPAFLDEMSEFFENCIAIEQFSTRSLGRAAF